MGHTWIISSELAGYKAKDGIAVGKATGLRNITTPNWIKQYFKTIFQNISENEAGGGMGQERTKRANLHLYR